MCVGRCIRVLPPPFGRRRADGVSASSALPDEQRRSERGFAEVGEELGVVVEHDLGGGVEGLVQHGLDDVGYGLFIDDRAQWAASSWSPLAVASAHWATQALVTW